MILSELFMVTQYAAYKTSLIRLLISMLLAIAIASDPRSESSSRLTQKAQNPILTTGGEPKRSLDNSKNVFSRQDVDFRSYCCLVDIRLIEYVDSSYTKSSYFG